MTCTIRISCRILEHDLHISSTDKKITQDAHEISGSPQHALGIELQSCKLRSLPWASFMLYIGHHIAFRQGAVLKPR